jgi:hypothetical protein
VDASLGITECVLLGLLFLFVRRAAVVLVNLDVIDKLRIVILPSVSARAIISALLATLFTSFRSRTALQIEILSLRHQLAVLQLSLEKSRVCREKEKRDGVFMNLCAPAA